jgi:hypothetical protein
VRVEEAREKVVGREFCCDGGCSTIRDDVDLLILEVQAGIDCEWAGGDQVFDCTGLFNGEMYPEFSRGGELCRTCTARAELAKRKVTA